MKERHWGKHFNSLRWTWTALVCFALLCVTISNQILILEAWQEQRQLGQIRKYSACAHEWRASELQAVATVTSMTLSGNFQLPNCDWGWDNVKQEFSRSPNVKVRTALFSFVTAKPMAPTGKKSRRRSDPFYILLNEKLRKTTVSIQQKVWLRSMELKTNFSQSKEKTIATANDCTSKCSDGLESKRFDWRLYKLSKCVWSIMDAQLLMKHYFTLIRGKHSEI